MWFKNIFSRSPEKEFLECETCRFWLNQEGKIGECRRFPPQMMYIPSLTMGLERRFPVVKSSDICGEYKP